jgi:polyketide synthase 12/myxalamid-type polyketide synthase MxaB
VHVARLARYSAAAAESYRLDSRARGTIDNLAFYPAARRRPRRSEVEIEVTLSALNFKDVMNALGLYPGDPGPLGSECAGRITAVGEDVGDLQVGDEVIAVGPGAFSRFVTVSAGLVARRPAHLTLEQAVTVPIAFLTAHFSLHHLAGLKTGDRVLIHAAAGGVGMAAVQLARNAGAEVFATAGTPDKRALLERIGVPHVMSSRTPEFADIILDRTAGRGVDVVLNSLSGDLLDRTFDVTARGGRFLEIGKNGIWSAERVAALDKGIRYFTIDWGVDAKNDPALIHGMFRDLMQAFSARSLSPLPARVFPIASVADAFRYMAQGRHTGKILVAHDSVPVLERRSSAIRADATYLITGGLSGLGLATARWLVDHGARHLALAGRRGVTEESQTVLAELEARGATVLTVRADVSEHEQVVRIVEQIDERMPPLRGVVHAAGVLDDGAIVQQDWDRFEAVLAPKVRGAWNLHTALAGRSLDFFVLYSSAASVLGSRGQANHAAANACLDALAHKRRADGLPALSINWGAWSEVGAAARLGVVDRAGLHGIGVISPAEGLEVLGRLIKDDCVQAAVIPMDWSTFLKSYGEHVPSFFSGIHTGAVATSTVPEAAPADTLQQQLEAAPAGARLKLLQGQVRERAARVLGAGSSQLVDVRRPLSEQGLDSLMAVELRNVLSTLVGRTLSATLLFDYPTVDAVAAFIASLLGVADAPPPAPDAQLDVLDSISDLSDEEVDRLFAERLAGRQ